jgi:hypothetical protein
MGLEGVRKCDSVEGQTISLPLAQVAANGARGVRNAETGL